MKGWHFLKWDRRLNYGMDKRQLHKGSVVKFEGEPILCKQGVHASKRLLDAMRYAPGPWVCRVEVGGKIIRYSDKFVGQTRKILAMADASLVLHEFACDVAEQTLATAEVKDPRSWKAIEIKRKWLVGKATAGELEAARLAAWSAVSSVADSVAQTAAEVAARAARAAAWSAARAETCSAAQTAAETAWSAARAAAQEEVWSEVGSVAQAAAWSAMNKDLTRRVNKLLGLP